MDKYIKTLEVERWSEPDEQHRVKQLGMAKAGEAFKQLQAHLEKQGLLPDDYFLFDGRTINEEAELPDYTVAVCNVNFGGSEGIYLDIALKHEGKLLSFATGKTLREDAEAFHWMSRIGSECSMMLNGRGQNVLRSPDKTRENNKFVHDEIIRAWKEARLIFSLEKAGEHEVVKNSAGQEICILQRDNHIGLDQSKPTLGIYPAFRDIAITAMERGNEYLKARPLVAEGLGDGYRILAETQECVFAVTHRGIAGWQYATWRYDYDRTGVWGGNYFEDKREAAITDFKRRSGLETFPLSKDEMKLIASCCSFRQCHDNDLSYDTERSLEALEKRFEGAGYHAPEAAEHSVVEDSETEEDLEI